MGNFLVRSEISHVKYILISVDPTLLMYVLHCSCFRFLILVFYYTCFSGASLVCSINLVCWFFDMYVDLKNSFFRLPIYYYHYCYSTDDDVLRRNVLKYLKYVINNLRICLRSTKYCHTENWNAHLTSKPQTNIIIHKIYSYNCNYFT